MQQHSVVGVVVVQRLGAGTVAALLCGLLVLAAPAGARAPAEPDDVRVSDVDVSDDGRVRVVVAAPALRAAGGDPTDAFEIREEGQVRDVTATPVTADDIEIVLVVDTSVGQEPQQLRELRNIAMELALRLPRDAPMALVATGDPPAVVEAPTTSVLERVVAAGRLEPGGERATYDALALAVEQFSPRPNTRRSVVLVGAVEDRASSATPEEAGEHLAAADAALYVIDPAADGAEPHPLDELATATGGLVVPVDRDPLDAATVVLADLLHQYRLTFEARGTGDTTVSIRVADGEATVSVPLPAPTPSKGREAGGDVARPPAETVPKGAWLLVPAAVAAALLVAGAALLLTRRPAGRHRHAAAGARPLVGVRAPGRERAGGPTGRPTRHERPAPAPTAGPGAPARAGAAMRGSVAAAGTGLAGAGRALQNAWAALVRAGAAAASQMLVMARRSAAVVASRTAVVAGAANRAVRGVATAGPTVRRRLAAAVRRARPARPARQAPPAPAWRDVAAQVHREVGGDRAALDAAAGRIDAARQQTAAALRAAGFEGRLALVVLTPMPVAVAVLRSVVDPAYLERLTGGALGWVSLAAAAALTAAGGLWLGRVAQPPFAALPAGWRAYRERVASERQIADALDHAALYASAGLGLDAALQRALPDEHHPANRLLEAVRARETPTAGDVDDPLAQERPPDWLAVALRWWSKDLPAPDVLAAARARLLANRVWEADQRAHRIPAAALMPFVVCIAPAIAIAGWVAGS